jgi:hypothetical protein
MMSISYVQFDYMSHLTKTHWPFLLRLSNLTRCINQIGYFRQVDWSKNTCLGPLVKMDMSINQNILINQLKPFEKPKILVV